MKRALPWLLLVPLWGCPTSNPGVGVTPTSPEVQPAASPTPESSVTPTATPTATPASTVRDDFDGSALDPERWTSFAQSGIIRLADGKLDLLNTGGQKNFPYVVTRHDVIPAEGPFFVEFSYNVVSTGQPIGFQLDYLPAEQPNEKALTTPFMTTNWFYSSMRLVFDTETTLNQFQSKGGYGDKAFHRVRVECDGQNNYRVIFDQSELGTFQSKRRPKKFWLGTNPVKDLASGANWPRVQLDYFEAGSMTTPDPAQPTS